MIRGIYNSFFDFRFGGTKFVDFQNYIKVFTKTAYTQSIQNTLLLVAVVVPMLIVLGMVISGSVFDKTNRYTSFVRISLYLPVIASAAVMSIIWRFLLDSQTGMLRYIYDIVGATPFHLLGDKTWATILIMFVLFSMNIGQCIVMYVASMLGISRDIIEALEIDGGNRFHLFRYILIPHCSPTTLLIFITQTSAVIRIFVLIQLLTNGGPSRATTTMMYLLYQEGFANGNFGLASALGMVMFLFSIILVVIQFKTVRPVE
jgi:multiple sugar transport system permease protein